MSGSGPGRTAGRDRDATGPPAPARRLVAAVAAGRAGRLLPPVLADGPDGTVRAARWLAGPDDARLLAAALRRPALRPVVDLVARLDRWCTAARDRYAGAVAADVLDPLSPDLFAPLVADALHACSRAGDTEPDQEPGQEPGPAAYVAERVTRHLTFLDELLARLARDLTGPAATGDDQGRPTGPRWAGPVTGLRVAGGETHAGGRRVVRVTLAGGARVAYKPRPASGEALFSAAPPTPPSAAAPDPAAPSVAAFLAGRPAASGPVDWPVLRCWTGPGADRGRYWWQEWVDPAGRDGVLRTGPDGPGHGGDAGVPVMTGTVLDPAAAPAFWRRAGALAALAHGFGLGDLHGENVVAGVPSGAPGAAPALHAVDLEVAGADLDGLYGTGLVHDPAGSPLHHAGLELGDHRGRARWCSTGGPPVGWTGGPDGLAVVRVHRPWLRERTRTLVADPAGRIGYAAHPAAFLRGLFDAWTQLCRNRDALAALLAERAAGTVVRVVRRPTADYAAVLAGDDPAGVAADPLDDAERAALAAGDVPAFFRRTPDGPLLVDGPDGLVAAGVPARPGERPWPPDAAVLAGGRLDLAALGLALRDAVEYAFDALPALAVEDEALGVALHVHAPRHGQVGFAWPQVGRRVTYEWDEQATRVRVEPLDAPVLVAPAPPVAAVRERLLRLDRADAAARTAWTDGGFADPVLGDRVARLTAAAGRWLAEVVDAHGWPGRRLVGAAAAGAACRLVQHLDGDQAFARRCLTLIEAAARAGDVPRQEVAYVTDAILVAEDRPQRYGTKFRRTATGFEPCPLEDPAGVDDRRAGAGLEPLAAYADRIAGEFADTAPPPDVAAPDRAEREPARSRT